MTMLTTALQMLVGLFVDDGSLALATIIIVLLSWIIATLMPDFPLRRHRAFGRLPWRALRQCHENGRAVVLRASKYHKQHPAYTLGSLTLRSKSL